MRQCDCCQPEKISLQLEDRWCPVCGKRGEPVSLLTVMSLVKNPSDVKLAEYSICKTHDCDVIYFGEGSKILKDQLKVPIWFKKDAEPVILCYCSNITDKDILKAMMELKTNDIEKILNHKGSRKPCECEINNPTGKCCYNTIRNFISEAEKNMQ